MQTKYNAIKFSVSVVIVTTVGIAFLYIGRYAGGECTTEQCYESRAWYAAMLQTLHLPVQPVSVKAARELVTREMAKQTVVDEMARGGNPRPWEAVGMTEEQWELGSMAETISETVADVERDRSIEHQRTYLAELGHHSDQPSTTQIGRRKTVRGISANTLHRAYESNELAADEQYRGKTLAVTGTIYQIGRDLSRAPFVVIGGSGMLDGVQCFFSEGASRQIAALNKGDKIVVLGRVTGKALTWVTMKDCALLPP